MVEHFGEYGAINVTTNLKLKKILDLILITGLI